MTERQSDKGRLCTIRLAQGAILRHPAKRQAGTGSHSRTTKQKGFVSWAALAVMLALAVVIGKGLPNRVGMILDHVIGKSCPVLVPKHILIGDLPKKYGVYLPTRDFHVPVLLRVSAAWLKDVLNNNLSTFPVFIRHPFDAPIGKAIKTEEVADFDAKVEIFFGTEPPFNFGCEASRLAEIHNAHSIWATEHTGQRTIFSNPITNRGIFIGNPVERARDNVGAFFPLGIFVSAAHLIEADKSKNISKKDERKISGLEFPAKDFISVFAIFILGSILAIFGAFIFLDDDAIGAVIFWCGMLIALGSPFIAGRMTN